MNTPLATLANACALYHHESGLCIHCYWCWLNRGDGWLPTGAEKTLTPEVGSIRDVSLTNIVATNAGKTGCSITGLPGHVVEDVRLSNITIGSEGGGRREWTAAAIEERAQRYPECTMSGTLPAYGLYCRHVSGLSLTDVTLRTNEPDGRRAGPGRRAPGDRHEIGLLAGRRRGVARAIGAVPAGMERALRFTV